MPVAAVSLAGVDGRGRRTAERVDAMGNYLEVVDVDAVPIPAAAVTYVVDFHSRRDRSMFDLPDDAVYVLVLALKVHAAVAVPVEGASPDPATTGDFG